MNLCVKPYGRSRWKGFCSLIDHLVKNILHIQYADGQIDGGWLFQDSFGSNGLIQNCIGDQVFILAIKYFTQFKSSSLKVGHGLFLT